MAMTLPQAAQSDDVTGALQQLLMSRIPTPEQELWEKQARQDTMQDYQAALRQPAMGSYSPIQHSLYSTIGHFGPGMPTGYAVLKGVADSGDMIAKQNLLAHQGDVAAAKLAYENAKDEDKADIANLAMLGRGLKSTTAKPPSMEQLRTVYSGARNEAAQIAKEQRFNSVEEQAQWIEDYANKAVQNYLTNFSTLPTGPRGTDQPKTPSTSTPTLEAVTKVIEQLESGGKDINPDGSTLTSPKGAEGKMQVMPATQKDPGFGITPVQDGSLEEKSRVGVQYTDKMLQKYGGDLEKTLAAYNMGPGALDKLIAQYGDRWKSQVPGETLSYIDRGMTGLGKIKSIPRNKPEEAGMKSEATRVGESYGKEFEELQKGRAKSTDMLNLIARAEQNLSGYETGKFTPILKEAAAWIKPLGFEVDPKLGNKEAFEAITGQLALGLRSTGEGGGMPGSMSDSDREFLRAMAPKLNNTPEGNRLILEYNRKVAQRQMEMANAADKYTREHAGSYRGFRSQWDEYVKNNPLFPQPKVASTESTGRIRITPEMLKGK